MAQHNKKQPVKTAKPLLKTALLQKMRSPEFLKNLFVFSAFVIFFILAIFLICKRLPDPSLPPVEQSVIEHIISSTKQIEGLEPERASAALPSAPPPAVLSSTPPPPAVLPFEALQPLLNRLDALEATVSQLLFTSPITGKLIAANLMQGVLHNVIPVDVFKAFLQKTPEPWAAALLPTVTPLEEIKSYPDLEALLELPLSSKAQSLWNRFKEDLKSLISIRKIDQKEDPAFGTLEDVKRAVQLHNIQQALDCYAKLPEHEKTILSSWQKKAQDRLCLETLYKNILLEMAKE